MNTCKGKKCSLKRSLTFKKWYCMMHDKICYSSSLVNTWTEHAMGYMAALNVCVWDNRQ